MGCNAIRTAHNPVAPEFLDLCDKMGFLVMNEIFDEWGRGKVKYGYNIYFDKWAEKDVVSFIHRNRNHPSVIMWSAGNEIREQPVEGGWELLRKLMDIFHSEDPTRPVTVGCDNIAADDGAAKFEFLDMLDIVGYNYVDRWHERRELFFSIDRHDNPEWKMVGTESVSNGGLRNVYSFGRDTARINPNYNTRMIRAEQYRLRTIQYSIKYQEAENCSVLIMVIRLTTSLINQVKEKYLTVWVWQLFRREKSPAK